eukprot:3941947-Rhodomonas_salina.3
MGLSASETAVGGGESRGSRWVNMRYHHPALALAVMSVNWHIARYRRKVIPGTDAAYRLPAYASAIRCPVLT